MGERMMRLSAYLLTGSIAAAMASTPIAARTPTGEQASLDQVERHVEKAEAIEAIKRLTYAFGYYRDAFAHERMLALFTDDATYDFANGQYVGKLSLRRLFTSVRYSPGSRGVDKAGSALLSDHVFMQPVITLASDHRTARARFKEFVFQAEHGLSQTYAIGQFENDYVKTDSGAWKISAVRHCYRLMLPYDAAILELPEPAPYEPAPTFYPAEPEGPDRQSAFHCHRYPQVGIDPPFHFDHPVTGERISKP